MMEVADLSNLMGFDKMLDEIKKSKERAERATVSRLLRKKRANGMDESGDPQ